MNVSSSGWQKAIDFTMKNIGEHALGKKRYIITTVGGKGLGKSTFLRAVAENCRALKNVSKVYYLDLDVGAPEFTAPGILSLFEMDVSMKSRSTEKMSNLVKKLKWYFLGDNNPNENSDVYMDQTKFLLSALNEIPVNKNEIVLINTFGWVTGLGAELITKVLEMAEPSLILHLTKPTVDDHIEFIDDCHHLELDNLKLSKKKAKSSIKTIVVHMSPEVQAPTGIHAKTIRFSKVVDYFVPHEEHPPEARMHRWLRTANEHTFSTIDVEMVDVRNQNYCFLERPYNFLVFEDNLIGLKNDKDKFLGLGVARSVKSSENNAYSVMIQSNLPLKELESVKVLVLGTERFDLRSVAEGRSIKNNFEFHSHNKRRRLNK